MSTSYIATTIKDLTSKPGLHQRLRWEVCEVFRNSRVLLGFWSEALGKDLVYYLDISESKYFAGVMYRGFDEIKLYADKHIRESGCTSLVHAVLDAVYHCATKVKHEITRYDQTDTVNLTYCVLNGCVQDSLGHVVSLRSSSPGSSASPVAQDV